MILPQLEKQRGFLLLTAAAATLLMCPCDHRNIFALATLSAGVVFACKDKQIQPIGLSMLAAYGAVLGLFKNAQDPFIKAQAGAVAALISLSIMLHKIPGFKNELKINKQWIKSNSEPYTMWWNLDKTAFGVLTLILLDNGAYGFDLKSVLQTTAATILVTMLASLKFNFVKPEIKIAKEAPIWAFTNALSVCPAEEAIFRLLMPAVVTSWLGDARISAVLSTVLFGLLHYPGGKTYMALSALAGAGYQYAYSQTGDNVRASIFAHAALNLTHFVGFTYPSLARP